MAEIGETLEIFNIQLLEEDDEIESCLDSESDFLDSMPKLVFVDQGSIKILQITCSSSYFN